MPDSSSKAASEGSTVTLSPSTFLVAMSMYSGQFEKLIFFWLVDRSLLTQDSAVCCAPSVPQALSSDPLDRARTDSDAPRRNVRRLTPLDCISAPSRALSCAIATPPERTISVGILSEQGTANKGFSRRETALQRNPLLIGPFSFDLPPRCLQGSVAWSPDQRSPSEPATVSTMSPRRSSRSCSRTVAARTPRSGRLSGCPRQLSGNGCSGSWTTA